MRECGVSSLQTRHSLREPAARAGKPHRRRRVAGAVEKILPLAYSCYTCPKIISHNIRERHSTSFACFGGPTTIFPPIVVAERRTTILRVEKLTSSAVRPASSPNLNPVVARVSAASPFLEHSSASRLTWSTVKNIFRGGFFLGSTIPRHGVLGMYHSCTEYSMIPEKVHKLSAQFFRIDPPPHTKN